MYRPHKLVNRDPRNVEHLREAVRLYQEVSVVCISRQTAEALGPDRSKLVVVHEIPADAVGVGMFYLLDQGLMLDDNVISKCADCGIALQIRPDFVVSTLLCPFCATDRVLADYWEKETSHETNT